MSRHDHNPGSGDDKYRLERDKLEAEIASIKSNQLGFWAWTERILKMLAAVVIPVLIFVYGSRIQTQVAKNAAAQEYVKTAVNILTVKSGTNVEDRELRAYAISLLDAFSPVKVPASLVQSLTNGTVHLPAQSPFTLTDEQGRVITDENGNPIGVNPPPNTTNSATPPH